MKSKFTPRVVLSMTFCKLLSHIKSLWKATVLAIRILLFPFLHLLTNLLGDLLFIFALGKEAKRHMRSREIEEEKKRKADKWLLQEILS